MLYLQAQGRCKQLGGKLACPRNELQNEMVRAVAGVDDSWIGVSDMLMEGTFKCHSGEVTSWDNFPEEDPGNSYMDDKEADYVFMRVFDGSWAVKGALIYNQYSMTAVCEMPCTTGQSSSTGQAMKMATCIPNDISVIEKEFVSDADISTQQISTNPDSWPEYMVIMGSQKVEGAKGRKFFGVKPASKYGRISRACRKEGTVACPRNALQQYMLKRIADDLMGDTWLGVDPGTGTCENGDMLGYKNYQDYKGTGDGVLMSVDTGEWSLVERNGGNSFKAYGVCEIECDVADDPECIADDLSSVTKSKLLLADEVAGFRFEYRSLADRTTYEQAKKNCEMAGGTIACPRNVWHQKAIKQALAGTETWIGINKQLCENGDTSVINKWQGQLAGGQASIMRPDGAWVGSNAETTLAYVCEIPCRASGVITDCIPKTFPEELDVNMFVRSIRIDWIADPVLIESLQLIVLDFAEGDLVSKPWEVAAPPATESTPQELKIKDGHVGLEGTNFVVVYERMRFWDAVKECQASGMELSCPKNELQQLFITSLLREATWLGITDISSEGTFECLDGTNLDYEAWLPSEPDNKIYGSPEGDFVSMLYLPNTPFHGGWMDEGLSALPDTPRHFACSKPCTVEKGMNCIPNDPALTLPTEVAATEKSAELEKGDSSGDGGLLGSTDEYFRRYYEGIDGKKFTHITESMSFWDASAKCGEGESNMILACPVNTYQEKAIEQVAFF